jgi:hypothetical protein
MIQQLASAPAPVVTGLLQTAESALSGVPATPAAAPAAPGATASLNLPNLSQPATPPPAATASINLPGAAATTAPVTNVAGTAPTSQLGLPNMPGLPTNLAALVPSGLLANLATKPGSATTNAVEAVPAGTAATAAQNPINALLPLSALP